MYRESGQTTESTEIKKKDNNTRIGKEKLQLLATCPITLNTWSINKNI